MAKLARQHGVDKQARSFTPWSHVVSLLGQAPAPKGGRQMPPAATTSSALQPKRHC
ncbi:MAG: hypothetical protein H2172_06060 [Opitutus sp.]|nr:hypothetical protein [Opitutus sp.]MCS6247203.1 hypothetical protein [Opitutus sp.]MCS6278647.1 hypothetical protein [Opitutus sp.]MCS6298518.1 hypothetical protein [Opitutus sp.]